MPVVINEFEAVADAPQQRRGEGESGEKKSGSSDEMAPKDVMPILRELEVTALRAWAH
jgi:hypothetical protein